MEIYTDGSCWPNPGPGAWSFVVLQKGVETFSKTGTIPKTTNNIMEMIGVLEAMLWAKDRDCTIYSDSQYVVNGVNSWSKKWARNGWRKGCMPDSQPIKNAELWQSLCSLKQRNCELVWVRAHNGNPGNERADELAENARIMACPIPQPGLQCFT